MTYVFELRERFHLLSKNFPGYDQVLTQVLFALIAREHILWSSKPGRAKSQVARSIFNMFEGATVFTKQIGKDTTKEELFGNVVVDKLMQEGLEVYRLENGLADVTFAYLDEMFDGSDFLLRTMLNVLNEREFHSKDMGTIAAPLHSVIATTNFVRMREATDAVIDRFMCKAYLHGIDGLADSMRASQTYLSFSGKKINLPPLAFDGLDELSRKIILSEEDGGVAISSGMRLLHVLLISEFQRKRLEKARSDWHKANPDAAEEPTEYDLMVPDISPRTMVQLYDFSRAAALLDNRMAVQQNDHRAAIYGLATIGDDSGDEALWATICDEYLGMESRHLKSLEKLGKLADEVALLDAERSETTAGQILIGGKLYSTMSLVSRGALDFVANNAHPALRRAKELIAVDIANLTKKSTSASFDLQKGWF